MSTIDKPGFFPFYEFTKNLNGTNPTDGVVELPVDPPPVVDPADFDLHVYLSLTTKE